MRGLRLFTAMALVLLVATPAWSLMFEFTGASTDAWDMLDLRGDGQLIPAKDLSCPPGYGPDVLRLEGTICLAMARDAELSDGTIVVLYRENAAREFDADGVILFWADYPQNISVAHNTKEWRGHVWLEQDNDAGFQFRYAKPNAKEDSLFERSGYGIVTDPWNRTKWIWQKVRIKDGHVWAKYWPAHLAEPEEWAIEADANAPTGKRFGIKINSGDIHLAYFAADTKDIPVAAPAAYLHFDYASATQPNRIPLTLFTNLAGAVDSSAKVTVTSNGTVVGGGELALGLPTGPCTTELLLAGEGQSADEGQRVVPLTTTPGTGVCTVTVTATDGFEVQRSFRVAPVTDMEDRIGSLETFVESMRTAIDAADPTAEHLPALCILSDAAQGHIDWARTRLAAARVEDADLSLRFAAETLAELNGYKGAWLHALAPKLDIPEFRPAEPDTRGIGEREEGVAQFYSPDYLLRFGTARLDAQSLVMGQSYEVTIPWTAEGTSPDRDFKFSVRLVSPLGNRTVAQSNAAPSVPTSKWKPGSTYDHRVTLSVLPEDPDPTGAYQATPPVEDETHYLVVTVTDPDTGGTVILGNEPGPQPGYPGRSFRVAEAFVSFAPLEIREFVPAGGLALAQRTDRAVVRNAGPAVEGLQALFTATSDTGRVIWQQANPLTLDEGASAAFEFDWTPLTAGDVTLKLTVLRDGNSVTQAERTVTMAPPEGREVVVKKANRMVREGPTFRTPIAIKVGDGGPAQYRVEVCPGDAPVDGGDVDRGEVTVWARPWFGYYDVSVIFDDFRYDERIIATVIETVDGELLVNGEPFIIKGTNVHGMDGSSPERTMSMMRVMRDLGFNAWRGDYPARWQVDLAYEMNTFYTVLAPFSCAGTSEVFARQEGPPTATSRELTRVFAQTYMDSAGAMLWNSCNEIGGESIDFLVSQYPVYRHLDPYQRPVHYANLYGQDYSQGQDVMGTNSYFGRGQRAVDRRPIIARSHEIGRNAGLPVIFCEFNSYYGAIQSTGAEALRDIFAWSVEEGMAGGFHYMKGDSTSHPGVFDSGFNTHKIHDEAIIDAFADARVEMDGVEGGQVRLRVVNKRRFHLRDVRLTVAVSGVATDTLTLHDIAPKGVRQVEVPLPGGAAGPAYTVTGAIEFVTHFGFKCKVPVSLLGG
ncbi:MAG: hypothetical protein GY851_20265 [bacterium]|nr:hypothetical protein [bacterium]